MEKDFLEIAKRNIEILQNTDSTEQDVKRLVVEPVMLWSGIDIYDPNVLREEFTIKQIKSPTKADYAILSNGTPKIAIEAKNINEALDNNLKQLIDYCNYGNIKFGLITNGKEWWFVDETWKDSADRVFLRIKLGLEYTELIKLMNPLFLDIFEDFAAEYKQIQNMATMRIVSRSMLEKTLCEQTVREIKEREEKRSELKSPELLPSQAKNSEFVNLSEVLEFVFNKYVTHLSPPQNMILKNQSIKIKSWKEILLNIIKSFDFDKINIPLKITPRSKYYLITLKKEAPDKCYSEVKFNDQILYVYTWLSTNYIIKAIDTVKRSANLPDDYIKFPGDWFEKIKKELEGKK